MSENFKMHIYAKICIFLLFCIWTETEKSQSALIDKVWDICIIYIAMLHSVHVKAPAKLNLHLKVCKKRPDGFHDIESIFQKIPLYDELEIEMADNSCNCQVICPEFALPLENTLTSAYKAFTSQTGITQGVKIALTKRIPSGAGMGGGSSDAAAVLCGLSELFGVELTDAQKHNAAAITGSDVFFFLENGAAYDAAVVSGRGENVRYIDSRRDLYFVLVCPGVHSSTGEAYSLVDEWNSGDTAEFTSFKELEAVYRRPVEEWSFSNSFTDPLAWKFPEIQKALSDLRSTGAGYVQMTGSGSVVFGVFASHEDAERACAKLRQEWKECYCLPSW